MTGYDEYADILRRAVIDPFTILADAIRGAMRNVIDFFAHLGIHPAAPSPTRSYRWHGRSPSPKLPDHRLMLARARRRARLSTQVRRGRIIVK